MPILEKVGELPEKEEPTRVFSDTPRVYDLIDVDLSVDDGGVILHTERVVSMAKAYPNSWIRGWEGPREGLTHRARELRIRHKLYTCVKTNSQGESWLYLKKNKVSQARLVSHKKQLPAPPEPFPWPELDMTDGGFHWRQDELDKCVRQMREQLFPDE